MQLKLIDTATHGRSVVHRLDPAWKIVAATILLLVTIAVPRSWWPAYVVLGFLIVGIYRLSNLPVGRLVKRLMIALPLVIMVAAGVPLSQGLAGGYAVAVQIAVRALLALGITLTLLATTPYEKLLAGLERLKVPRILVLVLAFMFRYMFVLASELGRMRQAKAARTYESSSWSEFQLLGHFAGALFVRAFERAERVYAAMCARGWNSDSAGDEP